VPSPPFFGGYGGQIPRRVPINNVPPNVNTRQRNSFRSSTGALTKKMILAFFYTFGHYPPQATAPIPISYEEKIYKNHKIFGQTQPRETCFCFWTRKAAGGDRIPLPHPGLIFHQNLSCGGQNNNIIIFRDHVDSPGCLCGVEHIPKHDLFKQYGQSDPVPVKGRAHRKTTRAGENEYGGGYWASWKPALGASFC